MTRDELLALPLTVDLVTAGRAIGVGRSKSYQMVAEDTFPLKVLRLGHRYRIVTADLLSLLGVAPNTSAAAPASATARNDESKHYVDRS